MVKKKKAILIVTLCAAVVLILAAAAGIWFRSPGVHFFWKFASFNLQGENCYIIDPETETIIDQTTMTMDGFENDFVDIGVFHAVEIPGYTDLIPPKDHYGFMAGRSTDGDWYGVMMEFVDVDGNLNQNDDEPTFNIQLWFPGRVPVARMSYNDGMEMRFDLFAVCSDSEDEALRIYQEYQESK